MARKRPFLRTDRLASQIRQTLSLALHRDTREEILKSIVITDVAVTSDLSLARVYWHALPGPAELDRPGVEAALKRANGYLRARIAEDISARKLPDLRFLHDDALDNGRHIESILSEIEKTRPADVVEDAAVVDGVPADAAGDEAAPEDAP